jgi:peptidoglycan/LPS O-acetylase OafA/YrhL
MLWYKSKGKGKLGNKMPFIFVILMGLLPCIAQNDIFEVFDIFGEHILEYSVYFLLGYFFLSNDNLLEKLEKHRFLLLGLFVLYAGFTVFIIDGEFYELASWLAILAILGLARHYLNFSGKITRYLSKSSFGIYLFHQSWIVITAFFIFKATDNPALQILLIFLSSIILTYGTDEIFRRVPVFRWMFGLGK